MTLLQIATLQSQQLNQPGEALPLAEKAVKLAPELFVSHLVLGRVLLKLGETERAVRELETAAREAPDSVMVHAALLHAYHKAQRKEAAAREQEVLKRLQELEAAIKGQAGAPAAKNGEEGQANPPDSAPE